MNKVTFLNFPPMQKNKKIREAKKRNFRSDEAVNTIENCRSHSLIDESGFREPSERISAQCPLSHFHGCQASVLFKWCF